MTEMWTGGVGFQNAPIDGTGRLVVDAIQSDNYQAGVSGWTINKDGSVEFNDMVARGELDVVGSDGSFVRAETDAGHAVVLLNPQNQPGYTWIPASMTGEILNSGLVIPSLSFKSPVAQGSIEPAAEIFFQGPGETDQNGIVYSSNTHLFNGGDSPTEPTFSVEAEAFFSKNITLETQGMRIQRGTVANLNLSGTWVPFGGGFDAPGFIELPDHMGKLVGVASGGTVPSTIGVLPTQMRPTNTAGPWSCACNNGKHVQVVITPGGNVNIQNADTGVTWVSLANCHWPIAGF